MSVLGTLVSDFKKAGEAVKNFIVKVADDAPAVVQTIAQDESKIAPVIESFLPGSAKAIALANKLLDSAAQTVEDAGPAASSSGLSVTLDQTVVNDIKEVIAAAKAAFGTSPAPAPVVPAPTPAAAPKKS